MVDVVEALKAAGWEYNIDNQGLPFWERDGFYMLDIRVWSFEDIDGNHLGFVAMFGHGNATSDVFESEDAALAALMEHPFGAMTVGAFCGVTP